MSGLLELQARAKSCVAHLISRSGYTLTRSHRIPAVNLNLLETAFSALLYTSTDTSRFRVLQIGAYNGVEGDPLVRILRCDRVGAILVEPQPEPFRALEKSYMGNARVRLENAAVAERSGIGEMYVPGAGRPSQMASLLPEHRLQFGRSAFHTISVRLTTIEDLLAKYGWNSVDLLQIDTEGTDLAILKMAFQAGIEPSIVNLESLHLCPEERIELRQILKDRAYGFVDWGFDTLAVKGSVLDFAIA